MVRAILCWRRWRKPCSKLNGLRFLNSYALETHRSVLRFDWKMPYSIRSYSSGSSLTIIFPKLLPAQNVGGLVESSTFTRRGSGFPVAFELTDGSRLGVQ